MTATRSIDAFKSALASSGADSALEFLNAGVPHRYSAVYRLEGDVLRNILLHDKAGEVRPAYLAEVPFETSCHFDVAAQPLTDPEFQLLREAAAVTPGFAVPG
jgi:hypothetical protein